MAGFFDGLQEKMMNPLFLGGASLLSGEGMSGAMRGMQMGSALAQQRKQQADEEARKAQFQGLLADPAMAQKLPPEYLRLAQMAGPEAGIGMLAKRMDPMNDIAQKKAEAELGMMPLEGDYKRALIAKMQSEAAGGGELPSNIKEWNAFQKMTPDQRQQYLVMKRSIPYLDTGTGYTQPNAADPTAAPRVIPKDIAGAEAQKVYGRETAEGQMQLPKTATALQQYEATDQVVNKAIDDAVMLASKDMTTGFAGGVMRNVPGSNAYDLKARLAPIKANLGFDKLQNIRDNSPTGGALGQVAVQELEMLQSTFASLDQAQSQEQFVAGLNEIKGIRAKFKELKRQAYERDVARFGAGNVPNPGTGAGQPQGVGPGRSAASPSSPAGLPSQAVQMLMSDPSPEAMKEFDDVFGQGAAMRVLGNGR